MKNQSLKPSGMEVFFIIFLMCTIYFDTHTEIFGDVFTLITLNVLSIASMAVLAYAIYIDRFYGE